MHQNWRPALGGVHAKKATTIAKEVARRCSVRTNIYKALASEQSCSPETAIRWQASSVAGGDASVALLSFQMQACFPGEGWDMIAHEYLARAIAAYGRTTPNISLFGGAAGLALIVSVAQQGDQRYASLRHDLDGYLVASIPRFIEHNSRLSGLYTTSFDAISGVAGVCAYITNTSRAAASSDMVAAVGSALMYLLSLANVQSSNGLYCYIANDRIPMPDRKLLYPDGYADTGLAHGVAGVVAALALALLDGWSAAGLEEGLAQLAGWLVEKQIKDRYGANWSTFLTSPAKDAHGSRAAWCYGVPGIARALYLAGTALGNEALQGEALAAMGGLIARPRETWGIASPNVCHGLSGIMQVVLRMYHDTGASQLRQLIEMLADEIFSLYSPDTIFGFQDKNVLGQWYDNPRLLEGAPGVALALLAASQPVAPKWDRLLLLS